MGALAARAASWPRTASGGATGTLLRELNKLAEVGILTRTPSGNQVHFSANEACPISEELRGIVRKTAGVAELVGALQPAQRTLRREINPNLIGEAEWRKRVAVGEPFLSRVMQGTKLFVVGGPDDLGEPAPHRKAPGARRRKS